MTGIALKRTGSQPIPLPPGLTIEDIDRAFAASSYFKFGTLRRLEREIRGGEESSMTGEVRRTALFRSRRGGPYRLMQSRATAPQTGWISMSVRPTEDRQAISVTVGGRPEWQTLGAILGVAIALWGFEGHVIFSQPGSNLAKTIILALAVALSSIPLVQLLRLLHRSIRTSLRYADPAVGATEVFKQATATR